MQIRKVNEEGFNPNPNPNPASTKELRKRKRVTARSLCSMEQLGVLLLPPGWDASPLQGYPQLQN